MSVADFTVPYPYRLVHLADVDSTNSEALRRAVAREPGRLWIVADRQSQGRGRSGRRWTSDAGNLFASLLLELSCSPVVAQQLSLIAGIAVIDAVRDVSLGPVARATRLKWPNDVLVGEAKAGGILVETTMVGRRLAAVIGCGVNLVSHPELRGRVATHLAAHTAPAAPQLVLAALATAMDLWLTIWQEGRGFTAVRSAWMERAGRVGEPLAVNTQAGMLAGRFAGLDDDGALLLAMADGGERRVTYGDVSLGGGPR